MAIRIPSQLARQAELDAGRLVEVSVESGRVVIEPVEEAPHYELDDLIAGITDENRHDEIDWGPAVGKEFG